MKILYTHTLTHFEVIFIFPLIVAHSCPPHPPQALGGNGQWRALWGRGGRERDGAFPLDPSFLPIHNALWVMCLIFFQLQQAAPFHITGQEFLGQCFTPCFAYRRFQGQSLAPPGKGSQLAGKALLCLGHWKTAARQTTTELDGPVI